jgi:FkbM family methyltransferase
VIRQILRKLLEAAPANSAGSSPRIKDGNSADEEPFFITSPTCQVPFLAFLMEKAFGRASSGNFVEVGAYDGYTYSNTYGLAQAGWHGLYVEPVPAYARACEALIGDLPNLRVANVAVGAAPGELELVVAGPYSTAYPGAAAEAAGNPWSSESFETAERVVVPVVTLDSLLEERRISPGFEVLVVDVEGGEPEVFQGFDLDRWRPKMLIVELTDWHPRLAANRSRHAELHKRILRAGYHVIFKDTTNTIFMRDDVNPLERDVSSDRPHSH